MLSTMARKMGVYVTVDQELLNRWRQAVAGLEQNKRDKSIVARAAMRYLLKLTPSQRFDLVEAARQEELAEEAEARKLRRPQESGGKALTKKGGKAKPDEAVG